MYRILAILIIIALCSCDGVSPTKSSINTNEIFIVNIIYPSATLKETDYFLFDGCVASYFTYNLNSLTNPIYLDDVVSTTARYGTDITIVSTGLSEKPYGCCYFYRQDTLHCMINKDTVLNISDMIITNAFNQPYGMIEGQRFGKILKIGE